MSRLALIFSVVVAVFGFVSAGPTVQRFKAAQVKQIPIVGDAVSYSANYDQGTFPYHIIYLGGYYYLLWYGNGSNGGNLIQKISTKGAASPFHGQVVASARAPAGMYTTGLFTSGGGLYALVSPSPYSNANFYMVYTSNLVFVNLGITVTHTNPKNFSPGFGISLTGTCAGTFCFVYYDRATLSIRRMNMYGVDQATYSYSVNLLGNEYDANAPLRTRVHGALYADGNAVLLDAPSAVFRTYNASSYSGTPPYEHYLSPPLLSTLYPENYIGRTDDGLDWIADLQTGTLRAYDLKCCTYWANSTDTVPPNVTWPTANIYYWSLQNSTYCSDSWYHPDTTGWPTVNSDNCLATSAVSVTYSDSLDTQDLGTDCSLNGFVYSYRYILVRTWTVADSCGNSVSTNQTIWLQSTPVNGTNKLTVAQRHPVQECGAFVAPWVNHCRQILSTPSMLGWLGYTETVTQTPTCSLANPIIRQVQRVYSGASCDGYQTWDPSNNSEIISLTDTTPPSLSVTNYTWNSYSLPTTPYLVTASDSCSYSSVTLTYTDAVVADIGSGDCLPGQVVRVVNRLWTATDTCGNTATATQAISITDTTSPSFSISSSSCTCTQVNDPTLGPCYCGRPASVSDNMVISTNPAVYGSYTTYPSTCTGPGTYIRTWTVTDKCGNVKSLNQTITVTS